MSRPAPRTARPRSRRPCPRRLLAPPGWRSRPRWAPSPPRPAQAREGNVVTPGDFTGYGFDQCLAPTQAAMDAWLTSSPFLAVGIYISGDSRACRSQPNLTPTWVGRQLAAGWRLLPITLGPQASCQPRFPRYGDDETISPARGTTGTYPTARRQGRAEAAKAVAAAKALGIVAGSTLWYDLEGFDNRLTDCRESALAFLSAWTYRIHALGYVSGVYSSASSGIKVLDDARVNRPGAFDLPDQIWIARWDGVANTSTSYIREDGWQPTPGSSSTRAATTRPGAACGSTSTATSSTSVAARAPPRRRTAAACGSASATTRGCGPPPPPPRPTPRGSGRCSACCRRRGSTPAR